MRRRRADETPGEDRGTALITVLGMLAIMSALAVVVVDAANMSVRRTGNQVQMEQTRWYLIGAETFAIGRLSEMQRRAELSRVDQDEWQGRPFRFALDDGAMDVSLRDGDNCFNLNSLVVTEDSGERQVSAFGMVQFSRLLDAVEVRTGQVALAAALADWIDSDSVPVGGGAEDAAYGGADAYRTSNTLLADVSELRHVRGFDGETVARLAPYVCVRPTSAPNQINPNTLTPEQAPLLVMAIDDLSLAAAAQIIRDRPRGGWEDVDAFLMHPRLSGLELNDAGRSQFSTRTRYYVLLTRVERQRGNEYGAALIEMGAGGAAAIVRRVFGVGAGTAL
jgi:general secretion pathway protein K